MATDQAKEIAVSNVTATRTENTVIVEFDVTGEFYDLSLFFHHVPNLAGLTTALATSEAVQAHLQSREGTEETVTLNQPTAVNPTLLHAVPGTLTLRARTEGVIT